jgi:hypothetical protein
MTARSAQTRESIVRARSRSPQAADKVTAGRSTAAESESSHGETNVTMSKGLATA